MTKEELRDRLRKKLNEKRQIRVNHQKKEEIIDENLKKLGINSTDQLKEYMKAIKDLDKNYLKSELIKMGLNSDQIDNFFKTLK